MIYTFQATLYCRECGEELRKATPLPEGADADLETTYDSDDYPKPYSGTSESDSVDHCGNDAECKNAIDLADYGLAADARLHGAESRRIGALLTDELTDNGAEYVRTMIGEDGEGTPYQVALWRLWREAFADALCN